VGSGAASRRYTWAACATATARTSRLEELHVVGDDLGHAPLLSILAFPRSGLDPPLDKDERMAGHYRLDAVRGHFFEMAGNREIARKHYRAAANRTSSIPERNYLLSKAARLI